MAKKRTKPEFITADDYLSIARNMIWLVQGCIADTRARQPRYRDIGRMLGNMINDMDFLRSQLAELPGQVQIVGVKGLPPNESLKKFAKVILESHRDSGGVSVCIGSSAFGMRLDPVGSKGNASKRAK